MSRAQFFDSLFEIVDVWTVDISLAEYVNFLKAVFHRITVAPQNVDLHPDAGPATGPEALKHKRLSSKRLLDPDQRFWAPTCEIVSLHDDASHGDAGADTAAGGGDGGGGGGAPPRADAAEEVEPSLPAARTQPVRRLGPGLFGGSGRNLLGGSGRNLLGGAGEGGGGGGGSPVGRKPLGQEATGCGASSRPCAERAAIQFTRGLKGLHEETQARLRERARLTAGRPPGADGGRGRARRRARRRRRRRARAAAGAAGCPRAGARWASSTTAATTMGRPASRGDGRGAWLPSGAADEEGKSCTTAARRRRRDETAVAARGYRRAAAARNERQPRDARAGRATAARRRRACATARDGSRRRDGSAIGLCTTAARTSRRARPT